ncbi:MULTISPECIES: hypothetical protein [unclassified Burkholderia]|uniref:hypothetical protein n=1 Tax=unclassified Burkholderia TaxID=2613784 RepID=UPI00163A157C|nr:MULTISPECIES: hypothetical protein [unclassified Burkholderia]
MEHGIVQTIVLLAILALALLFFAGQHGRDRLRDKLHHKPLRRPHRSRSHRHP